MKRYSSLVHAVVGRAGLKAADAEDAFQSTWIQVWESLGGLRAADRLAGWIAAVARSRVSRTRRGRKVASLESVAEDALATGGAAAAESFQEVRDAVARAGDRCRRLLRLLYWEEVDYAEISRRTGLAVGSIGPTRARCLRRLRDAMEGTPR